MDKSKVVVLKRFDFLAEAEILKALLEDNGIKSSIIHGTQTIMPVINTGNPVIELVVNEADLAQAQKVVSAKFDQAEFETESAKRRKKP